MLLRIPGVLNRDDLAAVRKILDGCRFVDGKLSAGMAARRVKRNEEVQAQAREVQQLNNVVMNRLVQNPVYRAGAMPLRVAVPYYARYTEGMTYGDHIDDPIMQGDGVYRSDVAITVFLSEPDEYDGGELVIRTSFGDNTVKLPAGDAVMYPASSVHQVAEVTRGARLVAVTWLQSAVRDPARRELLYELHQAREKMLRDTPDAEETRHVDHAYVNLVRMWAEL
jgi:PKHD-type hydroxylase